MMLKKFLIAMVIALTASTAVADSVGRLDATLRAAGIPIFGVAVGPPVRVDFQDSATTMQRTQAAAIVAAFNWSANADATWQAQQAKAEAATALDRGSLQAGAATDRVIVGLTELILDEFNLHSAQTTAMLSAIAAATTLADLKTRMALVNAIPARTKQQLVNAIKAKIAGTAE